MRVGLPTPGRRFDAELMDLPGLPEAEVADAYRVLQRVNGWFFGGSPSMGRELRRFLDEDRPDAGSTVGLLDVGSGSGDLPDTARKILTEHGFRTFAVALDRDATALSLAARRNLTALRADALRLPFPDSCFDLVTAVKFAHHFAGRGLERLLAEMARVARRRVVVLDIQRHWVAYGGFLLWSRIFTRNRLVRHDGPLSVLRGFTRDELAALAEPIGSFTWIVRPHAGFQLALVGRRRASGAQ